jgi:hypothetical protein
MAGFGAPRLKRNRHVNPDNTGNRPVSEVEISPTGTVVRAHWLWICQGIQDGRPRLDN